jgi:serine/threonine-protein kinase
MEYVEGETLAALLEREGPLPVDRAVGFAIQLADALAYAHDHGVIHRDMKPGNVLVTSDDRLVITDFGIALLDGARRLTWGRFGDRLGTPDYMPPEQIQGKRGDRRSDIYALGAVLFEMLTGRAPWQGQDTMAVMNAHLTMPVPPMADFRVDVPPALEGIVRRCLRKRPEERYSDATALLRDLEHWRELQPAQFEFKEELAIASAEEHLLLLVAGICAAFLAISTLLVTATYLVGHH